MSLLDPPDAKDFDDAVCITNDSEGTKLWVAIADVANYVHKGTRLDDVAKNRATSSLFTACSIANVASETGR